MIIARSFERTMTTKTRYGVYGMAAIVAILSLSLVATSFTTQEATAEAARKAGMSMSDKTVSTAIEVSGAMVPVPDNLGQITLKSNDKGDWMVEGVIECATSVQAKAKGKHSDSDPLSGGTAGAKVWITMDAEKDANGNSMPYSNMIDVKTGDITSVKADSQWNLCQQTFEMKSNFNDLIITCEEALVIDPDYAGCNEDFDGDGTVDTDLNKLVYLCDVDTSEDIECEQSLEVFTAVAGTHPIAYMLHNVEAADTHVIDIWAELSSGPSSNSSINPETGIIESELDPDTENFVDAGVVIGKRLFSVETLAYQG